MSLVNNSKINYSLYYNVLNYFVKVLSNHPSIQHVSQGDMFGIDTNSFPSYPVANIFIDKVRFSGSTSIYSCQLLIGDKIKNKENASDGVTNKMNIPFYGTDDTVDIHANTLAIINDIISFTEKGTTNFNIGSDVVIEAFKDTMDNGLAGWVAGFNLTTHNDRDKCLFDLLTENDLTDC